MARIYGDRKHKTRIVRHALNPLIATVSLETHVYIHVYTCVYMSMHVSRHTSVHTFLQMCIVVNLWFIETTLPHDLRERDTWWRQGCLRCR